MSKLPPDMADLRKIMRQVEQQAQGFTKPDDDWMAAAFLFSLKDVTIVGIDVNPEIKHQIPAAIAKMARKVGAVAGAMVMSIWHVEIPANKLMIDVELGLMDQLGVRSHPDRKESVQLELFDGKDTEIWMASINRYTDRPPTLGEWVKQDYRPIKGRFANLMERCIGKTKG